MGRLVSTCNDVCSLHSCLQFSAIDHAIANAAPTCTNVVLGLRAWCKLRLQIIQGLHDQAALVVQSLSMLVQPLRPSTPISSQYFHLLLHGCMNDHVIVNRSANSWCIQLHIFVGFTPFVLYVALTTYSEEALFWPQSYRPHAKPMANFIRSTKSGSD